MTTLVNNLCVIGTGLIGGSFCLALKEAGVCEKIIGAGRSEETLLKAQQLNIIDSYDTDISNAVKDADLIFVSVPLGAMAAVFEKIATGLKQANNQQAIITDAGGITSHAAIVSRELKTPCIIGTKIATKVLKDGDLVEVDANKGIVKKIQ